MRAWKTWSVMQRRYCSRVAAGLILLGLTACGEPPEPQPPVRLGGVEVPAEVIERGRFAYGRYCRRCHGPSGEGDGRHGLGLPVRPRDLTSGQYPHSVGDESGRLPTDEELSALILRGVPERGMPPIATGAEELNALVQYTKSLSPRWANAADMP